MKDDDTIKDAALAVAGAVAAVAAAPGAIAAAAVGLVGIGFERITSRDTRRAQTMFERLLSADEAPEAFAEHLRERLGKDDEDVIGAFRAMLTAAVDAVSPATIEVMAQLARRHLRGLCPVWLARGGLRLLAESTTAELGAFRELIEVALARRADGGVIITMVLLDDDQRTRALQSVQADRPNSKQVAQGHASRLKDLLDRHGLSQATFLAAGAGLVTINQAHQLSSPTR